ncbi:MAG TPA: LysR family transcriptional regulator [Candidatus Onthomonas avicola]|nr:LysR family transcriptional regulator [Candidatus Onthomonas avicola]
MFEFYQLEQLLAFAECGTLSGAAERLHLSQPALSRSMQRLEAELQVPLFDRQKNKIEFNENGRMAAEYARQVMEKCQDMISRIQAFDRSQRTILVGACAPAPLWEIPPLLSDLYPDRTISSEIRENGVLLQGLRDDVYQLIILPYPVEESGITCVKYGEEHLFFSLPPAHPLSGSKALYMKDLNGETMLLRNRLGFWRDITDQKMPDTRFLEQEDIAFDTLVRSSALPSFTTDVGLRREGNPVNRVNIPIQDEEANVTYYCLYKPSGRNDLSSFVKTFS